MTRDCLDRCGRAAAPGKSRCVECQRARWRSRQRTRDPLPVAVYNSREYRRARDQVLAGATHCAVCGGHVSEVGKLAAGHLVPIREAPEAAADPAALIPVCYGCNNAEAWSRRRRHER